MGENTPAIVRGAQTLPGREESAPNTEQRNQPAVMRDAQPLPGREESAPNTEQRNIPAVMKDAPASLEGRKEAV